MNDLGHQFKMVSTDEAIVWWSILERDLVLGKMHKHMLTAKHTLLPFIGVMNWDSSDSEGAY